MKKFIEDIQKFYKYAIYSSKAELKSEIAKDRKSTRLNSSHRT